MPCSEAYALLCGLAFDPRTHLYAVTNGQTFQGSQGDFAMTTLAALILNMGGEKGKKRIELPNPYYGYKSKIAAADQVTPAERVRLAERLTKYSSIPA